MKANLSSVSGASEEVETTSDIARAWDFSVYSSSGETGRLISIAARRGYNFNRQAVWREGKYSKCNGGRRKSNTQKSSDGLPKDNVKAEPTALPFADFAPTSEIGISCREPHGWLSIPLCFEDPSCMAPTSTKRVSQYLSTS
jgi:hypothetical protein